MRIKFPILALLLVIFFSCDKKEDEIAKTPIAEDPKEDPVVVDEQAPELTVNGFTDIIETKTDISISIVDDSTVETKVMLGEEEIATSTDKQFDVTINPYTIPVGTTEYTVYSKDAKGNETSEVYTIEIKHLLFTYEAVHQEVTFDLTRWIFLNDLLGEELGVVELVAGVHKIYSESILEDDNILLSFANYVKFNEGAFEDLNMSTYKIPLGHDRVEQVWTYQDQASSTLNLKLNGVPFENGLIQYNANGYHYYVKNYNGEAEFTNLEIAHVPGQNLYVKTNSWGSSPYFDGKKENYKYLRLNPAEADLSMEVESDVLVAAEENIRWDIPDHDSGTFYWNRQGFESQSDADINRGHNIYDVSEEFEATNDYVDVPKISGLNHYVNYISFTREGKRFNSNGFDDKLDITMPDWLAEASISDDLVELHSSEEDVDYHYIIMNKRENSEDFSSSWNMSWGYYIFNDISDSKKRVRLDLPEVITNSIENSFFSETNDLQLSGLNAYDFTQIDSYEQLLDWFAFNKNVPETQERASKSISFPIGLSNKVMNHDNSNKGIPNEYRNLHYMFKRGLGENYQVMKR